MLALQHRLLHAATPVERLVGATAESGFFEYRRGGVRREGRPARGGVARSRHTRGRARSAHGLIDRDVRVRRAAMDAFSQPTPRSLEELRYLQKDAPTAAERRDAGLRLAGVAPPAAPPSKPRP